MIKTLSYLSGSGFLLIAANYFSSGWLVAASMIPLIFASSSIIVMIAEDEKEIFKHQP